MPIATLNAEQFGALDETRRADYKQNGDVYELIIEGFDAHSSVVGLKANETKLLGEKKQAADAVKAWQALGKTPEEIKTLLDAQAQAETKKAEEEGRYQDIIAQTKTAHEGELKAAKDAAEQRESFLMRVVRQNLITRAATEAIVAAGGNEQTVAMLLPHAESNLSALEEGDGDARDFVVRVMGANKQPRVKNGSAEFMGVKDLALELKEKFPAAFPATGTGGGGSTGGTKGAGGGKSISRAAFDQLDSAGQMAHVQSGGTVTD